MSLFHSSVAVTLSEKDADVSHFFPTTVTPYWPISAVVTLDTSNLNFFFPSTLWTFLVDASSGWPSFIQVTRQIDTELISHFTERYPFLKQYRLQLDFGDPFQFIMISSYVENWYSPLVGVLSASQVKTATWPWATVVDCGKILKVGLLTSSFGTIITRENQYYFSFENLYNV